MNTMHHRNFASVIMLIAVAIFLFGCPDRDEPQVMTSQTDVQSERETRVPAGPETAPPTVDPRQDAVLRTEPQSQLPPPDARPEQLRDDFRRMQDQWTRFSREAAAHADATFNRMNQSIESRFQEMSVALGNTTAEVSDDIKNNYEELKQEIERATEHYWNETKDLGLAQKQIYEQRTRAFVNMIEDHLNQLPDKADPAIADAQKQLSAAKVGIESMERAEGQAWQDLKNVQDETVDKLVEACRELKMKPQ